MSDISEWLRESKRKSDKQEMMSYAGGMLASALLIIVASIFTGAFGKQPIVVLLVSIPPAFLSMISYWLVQIIFRLDVKEPIWWHFPVSLIVVSLVAVIVGNLF